MTNSKKTVLFSALAALSLTVTAHGQLLTFNTFGNAGTETSNTSSSNDAGVLSTTLNVGPGLTPAANANRLGGSNFFDTGNTSPSTEANAVAGNDYFSITITPATGFNFTLTSITFGFDHSAAGPTSLSIRSSADNYATTLGAITVMAASLTTGNSLTITGAANLATATTFHIYGYGATATAGTGGFDTSTNANDVIFNGTTAAVPEPSAYAAVFVGFGLLACARMRRRPA